jgi:hypothetical protein
MVLGRVAESGGAEQELQSFNGMNTRQSSVLGPQASGWRLFREKVPVETLGGYSVFSFLSFVACGRFGSKIISN